MKNITTTVKAGKLIIEVDLNKDSGPSSSGKNTIIATSSGNADVDGAPGVKIGLNVYRPIAK